MISIDPKERPALFALSNELKTIRDGATGPIIRDPAPSTGGTDAATISTGPSAVVTDTGTILPTPLNDLELAIASAKRYLDLILSRKKIKVAIPPASGSRLRGTLSKLAEPTRALDDNSALINAISEVSATLQKLAES